MDLRLPPVAAVPSSLALRLCLSFLDKDFLATFLDTLYLDAMITDLLTATVSRSCSPKIRTTESTTFAKCVVMSF